MNNTKRKELGLWYNPTQDATVAIFEKQRLQRLFNPRNPGKEEPTEKTLDYRELRDAIRLGRHGGSAVTLFKVMEDQEIAIKQIPVPKKSIYAKKQRVCPRILSRKPHKNKKPSKPSMFDLNRLELIKLGWKPRLSSAKKQRVRRIDMRKFTQQKRRGSTNEFTCKERRVIKNRAHRKGGKPKHVA
jgi:hypothetical protein